MDTEKRSHNTEIAQSEGVGARQAQKFSHQQGGGYLDNYSFSELENPNYAEEKIDPRLSQLRRIGLNETLLKIARAIGVDNFLIMWQILDGDERLKRDGSGIMLCMRSFASYKRMLRNEYIIAVAKYKGFRQQKEICKKVNESLGETIDYSNCNKIIERARKNGRFDE